ncbi:MAG: dual specificity protein phosphatase family protein [archaeon]
MSLFNNKAIKVLPWLYLGSEKEIKNTINEVDFWIDFRDNIDSNIEVNVPDHVIMIKMPFVDGDLERARNIYPQAKTILDQVKKSGKKALINCHMGASRSATLALWCMAEEMGYENAYNKMKLINPKFKPDVKFKPILDYIKQITR